MTEPGAEIGRVTTAGLFLTHTWSPRIERHFNRLVKESGSDIAWRAVRDQTDAAATVLGPRFEEMRRHGGVQGGFMDTMIWPHLLALDADFTWVMEYDVDYAGDWAKLFNQFTANPADFLATNITRRRTHDEWYWWEFAEAPPHLPPRRMIRALVALMRVSRALARAYAEAMQDPRWRGHYEFTIPTVALAAGLVVEDIGGERGRFRPRRRRSRNYSRSSFAWRPSRDLYFLEAPETFPQTDLLYHPVKGGVPEWRGAGELDDPVTIVAPTRAGQSPLGSGEKALPTVSVALATHNGAHYLAEQLESLARQELAPDELIVVDDNSTDGTIEIAREFASSAPFGVEVVQNRSTIGYSENFISAVRRCHGELIFFCDQDDIWLPQKIAAVCRTAAEAPEQVISHDIAVFSDNPANPSFPSYFAHLRRSALSPVLCVKGCATAVKADFLRRWGWPRVESGVSYDFWIALLATAFRQRRYVDQPLAKYRLHADNASGWIATAADGTMSAANARRQDTDLLIASCINRRRLDWTDEFARVLHERCAPGTPEGDMAAGFLNSLERNRARHSSLRRVLERLSSWKS